MISLRCVCCLAFLLTRQAILCHATTWCRTVEGNSFATFEQYMFKKSSQTKYNIQFPITPGIKVMEINMCLITPHPKGYDFATLNIE